MHRYQSRPCIQIRDIRKNKIIDSCAPVTERAEHCLEGRFIGIELADSRTFRYSEKRELTGS